MSGRLAGKVVLVTGAAQGTGEGAVRRIVAEGGRAVVADVQEERGRAVATSLGASAHFVALDVASESSWQRAIASALAAFGRLDGLVNNAGVLWMGALEHTPAEQMERVLRINLLGTMLGTKAVVPALRAAGGGAIVNVTSIEALAGMNSVAAYTASKWGARGFTKSAAIELGRDDIRVNCLCPSSGNPAMSAPFAAQIDVQRYLRHLPPPVLREGGVPGAVAIDDITPAICFLLSDEARRITGAELAVDGGWTAGKHCPGLPGF
ncbi:MAG: SDR family oxidoreductase [Deltaproteobacteria bacterium]|nr:SDR family oxidoreductase [Deltaproteobacteria bacterium]